MADLEEMGFIASPHTSAGRIPTPRGYRFFVDTLLTIKPLDNVEIHQLEGQLQPSSRSSSSSSAAQLLSDLTRFAGVVVTPRREPRVPAHRIPAPVGTAHPAHHRHARRRRAEPHPA